MNKGTIALITPRFHDRLAGGAKGSVMSMQEFFQRTIMWLF